MKISKQDHSIQSAFRPDHFLDGFPDGMGSHFWNLARNRLVHSFLKNQSSDNQILEIGCGRGLVVDYLRRQKLSCWGCDTAMTTPITEGVAPYIYLGQDAFSLRKSLRNKINTILVLDVLEHLPDPVHFLEDCRTYFPKATSMIVTLPARKELWSNYDDFYGHLRRYDESSTKKLMAESGLTDVKTGYFFHSLYFVALLLSLLNLNRTTKLRAPAGRLSQIVHDAISRWILMESKLLPKRLLGSSIYAIAKI